MMCVTTGAIKYAWCNNSQRDQMQQSAHVYKHASSLAKHMCSIDQRERHRDLWTMPSVFGSLRDPALCNWRILPCGPREMEINRCVWSTVCRTIMPVLQGLQSLSVLQSPREADTKTLCMAARDTFTGNMCLCLCRLDVVVPCLVFCS